MFSCRYQPFPHILSSAFHPDAGKGADGEPVEELSEQVVQVRRVTKVVKGGKQLKFRVVVIVGVPGLHFLSTQLFALNASRPHTRNPELFLGILSDK